MVGSDLLFKMRCIRRPIARPTTFVAAPRTASAMAPSIVSEPPPSGPISLLGCGGGWLCHGCPWYPDWGTE